MSGIRIARTAGPEGGRYATLVDGHECELTYRLDRADGHPVMAIDRTYVAKSLSGRGVGLALLERAVADARDEGLLIDPRCSFVRAQMARRPEWSMCLARPL